MKKGMVVVVVVVGAFLAGSVVYACGGWGGSWCMTGNGNNVGTQKMRSFQRETLKTRETLMDKQLDLQDELDKDVPDGKRIAALRKEIIDLQGQLQTSGDKYGMSSWGMDSGSGHRQMMNSGYGYGRCGW